MDSSTDNDKNIRRKFCRVRNRVERFKGDCLFSLVYVVVNFLSQVIFVFLLFWGMEMYANEIETKEK